MLIHRLRVAGLLSFGPNGVDLPMEPLNVLIGPNGSGKSNFLEAIALLRAAPSGITDPISRMGGVRDWLWKGPDAPESMTIKSEIGYPHGGVLQHSLTLAERYGRAEVTSEQVEPSKKTRDDHIWTSYHRPPGHQQAAKEISQHNERSAQSETNRNKRARQWPMLRIAARYRPGAVDFAADAEPDQSILSWYASPDYPGLWHLKENYDRIRLYRDWSFGPSAEIRKYQSAHDRADFLDEGGTNLALVLSHFQGDDRKEFVTALRKLFDGITDITFSVAGGNVALFLEEAGSRSIPATRLSDGTLRYLCLLAILLHPEPPPLVVIEEPELGLHPDLLPTVADLLVSASERSQLIVTTHSDVIVDALTDSPESVIVCEKHNGQTEMRRLDKNDLAKWLEDYSLGNLWSSGQLGGNRW